MAPTRERRLGKPLDEQMLSALHPLCFGLQQTTMQALAHSTDGYTSREQAQGRSSPRGSTRIR
jgi:hypothetical protein